MCKLCCMISEYSGQSPALAWGGSSYPGMTVSQLIQSPVIVGMIAHGCVHPQSNIPKTSHFVQSSHSHWLSRFSIKVNLEPFLSCRDSISHMITCLAALTEQWSNTVSILSFVFSTRGSATVTDLKDCMMVQLVLVKSIVAQWTLDIYWIFIGHIDWLIGWNKNASQKDPSEFLMILLLPL